MSRNAFAQCEREYNEAEEKIEHAKMERDAMKTQTITKEMFVHVDKYNKNEYLLHSCDMTEYGYVMVDRVTVEVTFGVPDAGELVKREVEMLKAKQAEINGKAYAEINALQNRIDSLMCIENKVSA